MRSYSVKENYVGSAVSKILRYTHKQTDIHCYFYIKKVNTSSNMRLGLGIPAVFLRPRRLDRCWPVVSWFIDTMAVDGCWPPSSSIENRSSGTEHMLVRVRTWNNWLIDWSLKILTALIKWLIDWLLRQFRGYMRVASISKSYLTAKGIIIQSIDRIGQF